MANLGLITLVLIEWVVGVTYLSPLALVGRVWLYRRPKLGISLWLGLFSLSFLASLGAVLLALWSVFENWLVLRQGVTSSVGWVHLLMSSLAPWAALALGGILASVANHRIGSLFDSERHSPPTLLGGQRVGELDGFQVIELPISFAYVGSSWRDRSIVQSKGARDSLTPTELESCLRHEVAHLRFRHVQILTTATVLNRLFGTLTASKAMLTELNLLVELAADRAVENKSALRSSLLKLDPLPSRELAIRLHILDFAKTTPSREQQG
ncbi:MAG: M48 family metalloprotease [Rhodoluna sp.]|nr:M48 family metalloprotease [Rhodoluna sp.]